ncbi:hypothetical protein C7974DRAFT_375460 [Boeremia exigua]|uniref:uncharacterized protein n=1 Tax=Boeremia exigua TaxID=749465 RepID=UPI001E8D4A11|nr:uncharacterized protein C7974DRAFT_375460 [Boeremia exigua]KAH6633368.1 hypothetical protein C7974DRAFT_375460 [Boeremia exigua]
MGTPAPGAVLAKQDPIPSNNTRYQQHPCAAFGSVLSTCVVEMSCETKSDLARVRTRKIEAAIAGRTYATHLAGRTVVIARSGSDSTAARAVSAATVFPHARPFRKPAARWCGGQTGGFLSRYNGLETSTQELRSLKQRGLTLAMQEVFETLDSEARDHFDCEKGMIGLTIEDRCATSQSRTAQALPRFRCTTAAQPRHLPNPAHLPLRATTRLSISTPTATSTHPYLLYRVRSALQSRPRPRPRADAAPPQYPRRPAGGAAPHPSLRENADVDTGVFARRRGPAGVDTSWRSRGRESALEPLTRGAEGRTTAARALTVDVGRPTRSNAKCHVGRGSQRPPAVHMQVVALTREPMLHGFGGGPWQRDVNTRERFRGKAGECRSDASRLRVGHAKWT